MASQECPVCQKTFPASMINRHVDQCLTNIPQFPPPSSHSPKSSQASLAVNKGPKPATEKFCRQMQEIEQQLTSLLGSIRSADSSVLAQLHSPCISLVANLKHHRSQLAAIFRAASLEVESPPSTPVSQPPPAYQSKDQVKERIDLTMDTSPDVERRKRHLDEGGSTHPDVVGVDGIDIFDDDPSPKGRHHHPHKDSHPPTKDILSLSFSSSSSSSSSSSTSSMRKTATSGTRPSSSSSAFSSSSSSSSSSSPTKDHKNNTRTSSQKQPPPPLSSSFSTNSYGEDMYDEEDEKNYIQARQEVIPPKTMGVAKVAIASTRNSKTVSNGGRKPDFKERKKRDEESKMDYSDSPDRDSYRTKSPTQMEDDMEMTKRYQQQEQEMKQHEHDMKQKESDRAFEEWLQKEGTCVICSNYTGVDKVIDLERCGHKICPECLCQFLENLITNFQKDGACDSSMICCPVKYLQAGSSSATPTSACSDPLPEWIQKKVLGKEKFETLQDASVQSLMKSSSDYVSCAKCGESYEALAGNVQLNTDGSVGGGDVDADGKPLTKEALHDRQKNRFRCPKCGINFCRGCKAQPYHLGYTCASWGLYQKAKHCRFCTTALTPSQRAPLPRGMAKTLEDVCTSAECLQRRGESCDKKLPCGHLCRGVKGEAPCLPCLERSCGGGKVAFIDDFCNICYTEDFSVAPTVQLTLCKHVVHYHCIKTKVEKKWPGARINFGFLSCPLCKADVQHPSLDTIIAPHLQLRETIQLEALKRLQFEKMENDKRLLDPSDRYFGKKSEYAMDVFAFYPCFKCKKPYFGGMRKCEEAGQQGEEKFDPTQLICGSCAAGSNVESCKLHKKDYIEYKCKFCCGVATWYCWGNTHFCDVCHKKQEKGDYLNRKPKTAFPKCAGPSVCPLRIAHPPAGDEFALGCGICRPRATGGM